MAIEVEDLTKPKTIEELNAYVDELGKSTGEALKALSDNDQSIVEQTKIALEEITKKIIMLDRKLELLSAVFEEVLVGEETPLHKLSLHQYKEIVLRLK